MQHLIIGTAGHVDHGKTALIGRLTGINTDRLREEQERGLSIDLGFAYFALPDGGRAGIIDVPGHERFLKNMLAGATGIDLVLLVIAADEGVMPQTREHLDIMTLLGVERGLVVITKADLVEADWLGLVQQEVREALQGTAFADAPMVTVSSVTDQGIDELTAALEQAAATVAPRDTSGPVRLNIDRVFTMRGFGTVVTGSLVRGRLHVDDMVEVVPRELEVRVRGIQVHGDSVPDVAAAQRVAANLARVEVEDLHRGDILAAPGSLPPTSMLDVDLHVLPSAGSPIRNRDRLRVHIGAAEVLGRVHVLAADAIEPGGSGPAQLRLEAPTGASRGERFVVRRYSPMETLGGGKVLDPSPGRHRRYDERVLAALRETASASLSDLVARALGEAGRQPISLAQLARALQHEPQAVVPALTALAAAGRARLLAGDRYVTESAFRDLSHGVLSALRDYHARQPLRPAMAKHELQGRLGGTDPGLLDETLRHLMAEGEVEQAGGGLRLTGHEVRLTPEQAGARKRLTEAALRAGFSPPTRSELLHAAGDGGPAVLALLLGDGTLVQVGDFVYHRDVMDQAKSLVRDYLASRDTFTVKEFRDLTGSTRKYVVPLLEHLDGEGFTMRTGDVRRLAPSEARRGRADGGASERFEGAPEEGRS